MTAGGIEANGRGGAARPTGGRAATSRSHIPGRRRAGWGLATSVGLLLAVIAPLALSRPTFGSLTHAPVILALGITWYSAGRLWLLLMAGTNRPLALTFWLFVYLIFGLVSLANTVSQKFPLFAQQFTEAEQVAAQITCIVGLAAYELGGLLARGRRAQKRWTRRLNMPTISPGRVTVIAILGIAFVTYFTLKYGLATRFSSRSTATETFLGPTESRSRLFLRQEKTGGLLRLALDGIPIFIALYLMVSQWRLRRVWRRLAGVGAKPGFPATVLLVAVAIATLLADNPIATSRARVLAVTMSLVLAAWPLVTPRRFRIFAIVLGFGTLFVYPYADYFRNDQREARTESIGTQFLTSPDYAMFQQEINAQVYVRRYGHTDGRQLLGVLGAFVPKSYWPDKPGTTGALVYPQAAETLPTSLSIWGWAYVDGGMVWVFVLFFAFGASSTLLETAYRRSPKDRLSFAGAAVPVFAASQTILLRGDPQPAMGQLVPIVILLVVACSLRGRMSRSPWNLAVAVR